MQSEFKPIVEKLEYYCRTYLGKRLLAAYLHGSIAKGDAVSGISDLDYFLIISDVLTESDEVWIRETTAELEKQYSVVEEVHLAVHTVEVLKSDRFALFTLKYNAMLRMGTDITEIPALSGCEIYAPDKYMAKSRLAFAKKCYEDALEGKQPACTGEIPSNTYYAARKFARYFVVIEGAYYLMSIDQFQSFDKDAVMEGLRRNCNGFEAFLDMAEAVLRDPIEVKITHRDFLKQAQAFMEWIFEQIAAA